MNVCFESNVIYVSSDTWWLDSGATIHACNYMQAVIRRRSTTSLEQYVYMKNGTRIQVDFLELLDCSLVQEFFCNCRMWCTYPRSGEIRYQYLFWIDFDIVFFFDIEKLNYTEIFINW